MRLSRGGEQAFTKHEHAARKALSSDRRSGAREPNDTCGSRCGHGQSAPGVADGLVWREDETGPTKRGSGPFRCPETYDEPGNVGRANPTGESSVFERLSDLLEGAMARSAAGRELQPYTNDPLAELRRHLAMTAAACRDREPTLLRDVDLWARRVEALDLTPRTLSSLRDFASIESLMARTGGAWWLTGV